MKKLCEQNFYEYFGTRIKTLRKKRKITQSELVDHLGISPTAMVNYENANRKIPLDIAARIAAYFNVSLDAIISSGHELKNKDVNKWNEELKGIVLRNHEINELIKYTKYLIYKRNDK